MKTYIDSSALVAVYIPERFSKAARRVVRTVPQLPFTQLHELEVPNAFELLVGRGLISGEERRTIQNHLRDDIEALRLAPVGLDLDRVFANASELSRVYTARFLTRSLDLLHVAAAQLTMCVRFVSADDRQLAVAKATGLDVVDIKRPGRRPKS